MTVEIPVVARNTNPESANPIHTEAAREHGFRGGIVPGVTLYAYLVRVGIEQWGHDWLGQGQIVTAFRRPVYDGDKLLMRGTPSQDSSDALELSIVNEDDDVCVTGTARRRRDELEPDLASYPSMPEYDQEPEVGTPAALAAFVESGGRLPDYRLDTSQEEVAHYLGLIEETDPVYERVIHPALVARSSAFSGKTRFAWPGARVHTSVQTRFLVAPSTTSTLTARDVITKVWERRGSSYLRKDMLIVDERDVPVMQIDSESIFHLGSA
ncbi:hypothetical protein [Blastococcus sp. SYSU DS1024]